MKGGNTFSPGVLPNRRAVSVLCVRHRGRSMPGRGAGIARLASHAPLESGAIDGRPVEVAKGTGRSGSPRRPCSAGHAKVAGSCEAMLHRLLPLHFISRIADTIG